MIMWERHPCRDDRGWKPLPQTSRSAKQLMAVCSHVAFRPPEDSGFHSNFPAAVIPHVHADPAADPRQIRNERLLNMKLDTVASHCHVFPVVRGPADPTDRPFDPVSSPDDGAARENRHDTTALDNELGLDIR